MIDMAWYYGEYECGHEGRVNIWGAVKERQRKADWSFSRKCDECRAAEEVENRQTEIQKAMQQASEMKLPHLLGTEKQVEWAIVLRQTFVTELECAFEREKQAATSKDNQKTIDEAYNVYKYTLSKKTDASFWIDNRTKETSQLLWSLREEYITYNYEKKEREQ